MTPTTTAPSCSSSGTGTANAANKRSGGNTHLRVLDLSGSRLGHAGASALSALFATGCARLVSLGLAGAVHSVAEAALLADGLEHDTRLLRLDVGGAPCLGTPAGARELARVVARHPALQTLGLEDIQMDELAAKELLAGIALSRTITTVRVGSPNGKADYPWAEAFCDALAAIAVKHAPPAPGHAAAD
jgi:hypothetical protein